VFNNPLSFTDPTGYYTAPTSDLEQKGKQFGPTEDQVEEIEVIGHRSEPDNDQSKRSAFDQAAQDRGNEISREMQNQQNRVYQEGQQLQDRVEAGECVNKFCELIGNDEFGNEKWKVTIYKRR
jgi:hypothetical protein